MFATGGGFGNVVFGLSVGGMSMILTKGLGLACRVNFDGVGYGLGVNGAGWFLNLSIRGLRHCLR